MSLSLERAQRILDENCAEWVREIGLSVVRIDKRGATLKLPRSPRLERVGGTISGQAVMALIDTAMIIAICGHAGEFVPMTTISQTTNFMRPLQGDIEATAAVIKAGRSTVFGEIHVGLIGSADAAVIASSIFSFLPTSP